MIYIPSTPIVIAITHGDIMLLVVQYYRNYPNLVRTKK